jgi:hypothetical protein
MQIIAETITLDELRKMAGEEFQDLRKGIEVAAWMMKCCAKRLLSWSTKGLLDGFST